VALSHCSPSPYSCCSLQRPFSTGQTDGARRDPRIVFAAARRSLLQQIQTISTQQDYKSHIRRGSHQSLEARPWRYMIDNPVLGVAARTLPLLRERSPPWPGCRSVAAAYAGGPRTTPSSRLALSWACRGCCCSWTDRDGICVTGRVTRLAGRSGPAAADLRGWPKR